MQHQHIKVSPDEAPFKRKKLQQRTDGKTNASTCIHHFQPLPQKTTIKGEAIFPPSFHFQMKQARYNLYEQMDKTSLGSSPVAAGVVEKKGSAPFHNLPPSSQCYLLYYGGNWLIKRDMAAHLSAISMQMFNWDVSTSGSHEDSCLRMCYSALSAPAACEEAAGWQWHLQWGGSYIHCTTDCDSRGIG